VTTMPVAETLLSLDSATVRFGAVTALRDVRLQLRRGDRLALVGANGSGKTTLLRLLNGLLPPSGGRRELHRLRGSDRWPVAAMLFQRPFLLHLSVWRNLMLALWLGGVPRAERRARGLDALARVGLQATADRPARALSGGQQQRLALARAWALQPDILFLDEPTASLDPSAKREVEALIDDFAHAGMTLVMSTHNLGQVKRLATRVAYLEAGRLVVDRTVDQFFNDELPHEAAQFLKGELPWT
jgi:tungstate transport system ATP-binding protein